MDRENVIKEIKELLNGYPLFIPEAAKRGLCDALALLEEQDELLRKLQKDKDKLCFEVSEWKHKFNDAPPKFVSQGVVDQIRWERDTALSQLEQIGKGLGSKMDDIVAVLKEQENASKRNPVIVCPHCGKRIK